MIWALAFNLVAIWCAFIAGGFYRGYWAEGLWLFATICASAATLSYIITGVSL